MDAAWNDALNSAAAQLERYAHRSELTSPEQRRIAISDALQHAVGILSLGRDPVVIERLMKAADAVKDDICSLLCPSHWKTGHRPPHHPKCQEYNAALPTMREAADEIERLRTECKRLQMLLMEGRSVHGGWPDVAGVSISTQHDQHVHVWRAHHLLRAQLIASAKAR